MTGALMFNREYFAQVFEGVHDQIQETFERIQCDPRHDDVVVLDFEPVDARRFSRWSMGYIGCDTLASKEFTQIQPATGFDVKQLHIRSAAHAFIRGGKSWQRSRENCLTRTKPLIDYFKVNPSRREAISPIQSILRATISGNRSTRSNACFAAAKIDFQDCIPHNQGNRPRKLGNI
ncbi:MAG: BLUF domain-containing protein [Nitrosomonas sp.]|nr:BLUF domain-containing protein [Nitrosomonas sp.]